MLSWLSLLQQFSDIGVQPTADTHHLASLLLASGQADQAFLMLA